MQHFADGIPFNDFVDGESAGFVDADVHGIGVAEQIVQIAEDFLVRADEKRCDEIIRAVSARMPRQVGSSPRR